MKKKLNFIIFSLFSFLCLSIGALFGFAYIQFWSKETHKKIIINDDTWKKLADSANNKEINEFKSQVSNSNFVTNLTNELIDLPHIKLEGNIVKSVLEYVFPNHINGNDFNINGVYNFSTIEKIFSKWYIPYAYAVLLPIIDSEIDKINGLPNAFKQDLKNFFEYDNILSFLKYLASVYPDDFYLYLNIKTQFNLKNELLTFLEKNKKNKKANSYSHNDSQINVSHTFDISSLVNLITIEDKNKKPIDTLSFINKSYSFIAFFGYYFDNNFNLTKEVANSKGFNIVKNS